MLFQSAFIVDESFRESGYIYIPLIKKTAKGYTKFNRFLIKRIAECISGENRLIASYLISILMHRLNSQEYRKVWNKLFPENTVEHFISKYGLYSASNDKSESGFRIIREQNLFTGLEYVRKKLKLSNSPILVIGCRLVDWQREDERKPSSNHRSSSVDRFYEIALKAIDLGYQVVTVGDPNFVIRGNDTRIVNYANSKFRSTKLDVLIVTSADVIVGNLFGALDMRHLSKDVLPFLSVDNPLPSIFFNSRITMSVPTLLTDSADKLLCLSNIMKKTNWDGIGWTIKSGENITHQLVSNEKLLRDFIYFIDQIHNSDFQPNDAYAKRIFEYMPRKYEHIYIQAKQSSCELSPEYLRSLKNYRQEIFC